MTARTKRSGPKIGVWGLGIGGWGNWEVEDLIAHSNKEKEWKHITTLQMAFITDRQPLSRCGSVKGPSQTSNQFHQKKYPIYRQNYLSAAAAAFCLSSCCWINTVPCEGGEGVLKFASTVWPHWARKMLVIYRAARNLCERCRGILLQGLFFVPNHKVSLGGHGCLSNLKDSMVTEVLKLRSRLATLSLWVIGNFEYSTFIASATLSPDLVVQIFRRVSLPAHGSWV
ncbi:uncharacterized protein H6S33_003451 [Morchella sextelata]|uniref:uncharacterized protein n=1 Tax=Morchella sextelata TaxID=1174677 RepID=UPI001D04C146|nr:uncharacterized protein H6S33_003451 [Morchella sextelata]KAH0606617.1 hypothetical protein H6S33_003451 [Morchella sextelata]